MSDSDYPPTRPNWIGTSDAGDPAPPAIHLGLGVYVSPDLRAKIPTELGGITMGLQLVGGRYVVRSLKVTRFNTDDNDTPPITSELLRRLRVQELVNETVPRAVRIYEPGSDQPREAVLTDEEREALVAGGPTDALLHWVGRLYLLGLVLGTGPAKYVRETLGIPASTAGNWVRRAKDKGLIADG